MNRLSGLQLLFISWVALVFVGACATVADQKDQKDQKDWIKVGYTTKEEVVERYGQPDLVMASETGETVTYRPRDPRQSAPRIEIPTVQAGPLGTTTTRMEPVTPGMGTRPVNGGRGDRPEQELRIRYDGQGVVQEVIR
jgi:hypothetical protein